MAVYTHEFFTSSSRGTYNLIISDSKITRQYHICMTFPQTTWYVVQQAESQRPPGILLIFTFFDFHPVIDNAYRRRLIVLLF